MRLPAYPYNLLFYLDRVYVIGGETCLGVRLPAGAAICHVQSQGVLTYHAGIARVPEVLGLYINRGYFSATGRQVTSPT